MNVWFEVGMERVLEMRVERSARVEVEGRVRVWGVP
jgi:hypothetical protein